MEGGAIASSAMWSCAIQLVALCVSCVQGGLGVLCGPQLSCCWKLRSHQLKNIIEASVDVYSGVEGGGSGVRGGWGGVGVRSE